MADGDEQTLGGDGGHLFRLQVAHPDGFNGTLGRVEHLFDGSRRDEVDLLVAARAVQHDPRRAKLLSPVEQVDLAGKLGEEDGLFHRRIAATHHDNFFAAEKVAVAGGARGNAVADQLLFRFEAQQPRRSAGGDDQRLRLVASLPRSDLERSAAQVRLGHRARLELGAEARRLLAHVLDQVRPEDAVREAGEILYHRGQRELPARLVAVNDQRLQVGARSVNGRGQSGAAATDDDDVVHVRLLLPPLDSARACFGASQRAAILAPNSTKCENAIAARSVTPSQLLSYFC